jgi:hypothetical protein
VSSAGVTSRSPISIGTSSPKRRLNWRATRSGSLIPRRTAESPTSTASSSRRKSTEGMLSDVVPSGTASARPSRHSAAAV